MRLLNLWLINNPIEANLVGYLPNWAEVDNWLIAQWTVHTMRRITTTTPPPSALGLRIICVLKVAIVLDACEPRLPLVHTHTVD